jgi:hypothetical protein
MDRHTLLVGPLALLPLVAFALAAAPVPKEDDAARLRRLYGTPVDPDKDCIFKLDGDALQVMIPATRHVVEQPPQDCPVQINAPYTETEVTGDFTATLRVAFPIRQAAPPRDKQTASSSAGLIAIGGGEVVLVMRRESTFPKPLPNPQQEDFHFDRVTPKGRVSASAAAEDGPGNAAYLRLTRTGKVVTGYWGRDGKKWHEFMLDHRVGWDETVRVGVVAENKYRARFEATFDRFRITQQGK